MHRTRLSRARGTLAAIWLSLLVAAPVVILEADHAAAATTRWVAGAASCSDSGPGTQATPYCTIGKGAKAAQPGDTVMVAPGVYREDVRPPRSGTSSSPISFQASAPGVVVQGSTDVTDAASWSPVEGDVWVRQFTGAVPLQVFVDGQRLAKATSPSATTSRSFFFDAATSRLYVDAGGDNPGMGHTVEASSRKYGFYVSGRSWVVIDGFDIRYQNSYGVRVSGGSNVTLSNLTVTASVSAGIYLETPNTNSAIVGSDVSSSLGKGIKLSGVSGATLAGNDSHHNGDHGISLANSNANVLRGNASHDNAVPGRRQAVGIDVYGSDGNVIRASTLYHNQDSGMNTRAGSDDTLVVRNLSFGNGDHGFDTVGGALRTRYMSNTSYGNVKDGFSIEGSSTGTTVRNCIAVDNGLATGEFDLYVSRDAFAGFSSDYNLFWNSSAVSAVRVNGVRYATLSAFRSATLHEDHGVDADARLAAPAAGDLSLTGGSPAIDAADAAAAGFDLLDHDGAAPFDEPTTANTGRAAGGLPPYADLGALEWTP
jgi:parallel beta-helix repeat protein